MKKLLIAAVAVSALASAAPSFAQTWGGDRGDRIATRIDMGVRNGSLTWGEAQNLRAQLRGIERLEARYRYNGLTSWEVRDLDQRYDALSANVRFQRHDNQYRYDRRYDNRGYDDWRY